MAAVAYLQKHLPFNNKVIEHAQFLDPVKRNDPASTNAISNLAFKIVKLFGTDKSRVFGVSQDVSAENIVDINQHQWKMYLVEDIPQSFHIIEAGNTEGTKRVEGSHYLRVDDYWNCLNERMNDGGIKKCPQLFSLIKAVLSISHVNVERGFSINKNILSLHGNSLKECTIVALRIVKDFVCSAGGATKVNITLPMIKSMKEAYSRYSIELTAQRELEAKVAKEKKDRILEENFGREVAGGTK